MSEQLVDSSEGMEKEMEIEESIESIVAEDSQNLESKETELFYSCKDGCIVDSEKKKYRLTKNGLLVDEEGVLWFSLRTVSPINNTRSNSDHSDREFSYPGDPEVADDPIGCMSAVSRRLVRDIDADYVPEHIPKHRDCNRPLEMKCALAYHLRNGIPRSIFEQRDSVHIHDVLDQERDFGTSGIDAFLAFVDLIYRSSKKEIKKHGVEVFGDSCEFIVKELKGNQVFREGFYDILCELVKNGAETRVRWDHDYNVKLNNQPIHVAIRDVLDTNGHSQLKGQIVREMGDFLYENKSEVIGLYGGKNIERCSDLVVALCSHIYATGKGAGSGFFMVTEGEDFQSAVFGNEGTLSCTFGPSGYNYHVAMQQFIDPHIGLLQLFRAGTSSVYGPQTQPDGVAYIFECIQDDEIVWLVDGVDVGPACYDILSKVFDFFFDDILDEARKAPLKPKRVLFNQHVDNVSSHLFADYIGDLGRVSDTHIRKIGGSEVLSEAARLKYLFEDSFQKISGRGSHNKYDCFELMEAHYLEALHYSTGSVWSESCEGIVNVIEIPVK